MQRIFPFFFILLSYIPAAEGGDTFPTQGGTPGVTITADQWARPRDGDAMRRLPGLDRLVGDFDRQPDGRILIRHGSGDAAILWAEELRSWLVALGIPSARVSLEQVPGIGNFLVLEVRSYGGNP